MKIQEPSVAGMFYPADDKELSASVDMLLAEVKTSDDASIPKAIIAPHAGYVYSGSIAASAYASWQPIANMVKTVIVMAPSHKIAFNALATSSKDAFLTPLGEVVLAKDKISMALELEQVIEFDEAFVGEHALEVHLPFLQKVFGKFKLVPFVVGNADAHEVAEVLELLWGDDTNRIVISSDLSHFLDYSTAKQKDQNTTESIETLNPQGIQHDDACGRNPIKGLLLAAKNHQMRVKTLDLRNSGDTAGDKSRVVGYGAYGFYG